jgi:hypothetical protein
MTSSKRENENQNISDKQITGKTLGKKAVIGVNKTRNQSSVQSQNSDMY